MKIPHFKFILLAVTLGVIVYANSVGGGFVSDDIPTIVENPKIGEISACSQLPSLTNFISYKIGGLNPAPYHLANIILHCINSILVFYFLLIFFKVGPSFFGTLLFAAHPIHTEAVSWISGKPYLFLTLFVLSSFLLYRRASSENKINPAKRRTVEYLTSLFLFILSLSTNWYSMAYPGMIALYDITYKRARKNWKLWLPYIVIALVWALARHMDIAQRVASSQADLGSTGINNPIFNMAFSLFSHAGLLIWPAKLTFYHEPLQFSPRLFWVKIPVLFLILCSLPFLFKRTKPVFFAIGVFILFLSPTYSPIPIASLVSERYLYLPSISFCMLAAYLLERFASADRAKWVATICLVTLVGAYSVRTIFRNNDWKDKEALWRATVKVSPASPRAHNNLAIAYTEKGWYDKAIVEFREAIKLDVKHASAHYNLGKVYSETGWLDKAIDELKEALKIDSDYAEAHNNLGKAYAEKGWLNKAEDEFKKAIRVNPSLAEPYANLGNLYDIKGRPDEAIREFIRALKLNPDFFQARSKLGVVYARKGWYDKAINEYKEAVRLNPEYAIGHYNLGNVYAKKGLLDEAINGLREAVRLKPDFVEAHNNLGHLYDEKGWLDKAISEFKEALRLKPNSALIHSNLGDVYYKKELFDLARNEWEKALEINPGLQVVRDNLKKLEEMGY